MASIYDPIKIGTMELPNRFVSAPTVRNNADERGFHDRVLLFSHAFPTGPAELGTRPNWVLPAIRSRPRDLLFAAQDLLVHKKAYRIQKATSRGG